MKNISQDRPTARLLVNYIRDNDDKNAHKITVTNKDFKAIRNFVLNSVHHLPRYIQRRLIRHYVSIFNKKLPDNNEKFANIWLRETINPVKQILVACPFKNKKALRRDELLREYAQQAANTCAFIIGNIDKSGEYKQNLIFCYKELSQVCHEWHVEPPYYQIVTEHELVEAAECAILRMTCDKWWLRKLTRIRNQTNEHILIAIGEVQKKLSPYVSAQALSEWKQQQRANRAYLEAMELVSSHVDDSGNEFELVVPLSQMADASSANPKNRFTELMIRCRGLENLSIDDGYKGLFLTLTAPSKYHATLKNGQKNPKWLGNTPKEAQAYLVDTWAKIRARLSRVENIHYYGVRVTEPHHDATPHWHLLVFVKPELSEVLIDTCRDYALKVDGDERGAQQHRFTVEEIDPSKGSATGYIAKYLSKNINGEYLENNQTNESSSGDYDSGKSASEGAQRATAWASRWGLRQFQFFGAEPVTIYREARRLTMTAEDLEVEKIRQAVESKDQKGKWYAFTQAMRESRVSLAYELSTNNYAEAVRKIKGIISATGYEETRTGEYLLRKRGSGSTWSPVNNCTHADSQGFDRVLPESAAKIKRIYQLDSGELAHLFEGNRLRLERDNDLQIINGQLREFYH